MSIRTYIFALLTSLVLFIAVILSYQSARLFIGSFDMVIEDTMLKIAEQYPEQDKIEQKILEYHVTTDWQKVPQQVRDYFPVIPIETEKLHTKFVDWAYIAPPQKIYSILVLNRDDGQVFVSKFNENIHQEMEEDHDGEFFIDPMVMIVLVGLSGIAIFIIVLLYVFKKVALPMESLQQWAKQLKLTELNNERPDFRFKELNGLATLIHNNLASVADSVEREQAFLSYASHELRTPIAVMRSNSALLEKVNPSPSEKERVIRDRIQRASLTMKSMTETLLWLSREGDADVPIDNVHLGKVIENTQAELTYLLAGKSVSVSVDIDDIEVSLAEIPAVIVLSNLIRNAFQHTQQGTVTIKQQGHKVTIVNVESNQDAIDNNHEELGFGLGMQLVEKLSNQFGWQYEITQDSKGYQVSIIFS
ncbi:sensor histidine kinase [Colwellia psychrerythraea]|uniref:histidine kinase n=1 Tax=Colwellia psychrerythraea TaxID=28229 RepID=A0A099KNS4_COLPS|nr:HAMP domain-containing sensor histidine kinase [Colwellia psychrerythraea]KGJ91552.1 integral membrane sensor signal transduction histidine kinase [Colwellia psychrerythraea]